MIALKIFASIIFLLIILYEIFKLIKVETIVKGIKNRIIQKSTKHKISLNEQKFLDTNIITKVTAMITVSIAIFVIIIMYVNYYKAILVLFSISLSFYLYRKYTKFLRYGKHLPKYKNEKVFNIVIPSIVCIFSIFACILSLV